jgi:hypothetical protein
MYTYIYVYISVAMVCRYDHDVRIPMVMRGPGMAKGTTFSHLASNVDVAPTLRGYGPRGGDQEGGGGREREMRSERADVCVCCKCVCVWQTGNDV